MYFILYANVFIEIKYIFTHMNFNCPSCGLELIKKEQSYVCSNCHSYTYKNGVLPLMSDQFKLFIDDYLICFEYYRKGSFKLIHDKNVNHLPYASFDAHIWGLRQKDIHIVKRYLPRNERLKILDFGSWNGWLSHVLSKNHEVVGVDYFKAPFDGLETVNFYQNKYTAIQAELTDLKFLNNEFDLIVVNRCLAYYDDVNGILNQLKSKLNQNGIIILTGLLQVKNIELVKENIKLLRKEYYKKYQKPLYIHPVKGYLTKEDFKTIENFGFKLHKQFFLNLKSSLKRRGITYYFGVYYHE